MGTSKRRLNEKVKKLLQKNPDQSFDEAILQASSEALRIRPKKQYYSETFSIAIGAGLRGVQSILSGNFRKDYNFDSEITTEPFTIQTIIEKITDTIDDNLFEESEIISISLKCAITAALLEKNNKEEVFVKIFCSKFIFAVIYQSIAEAISDQYPLESSNIVDKKVEELSERIVSIQLREDINEFLSSPAKDTDKLIGAIIDKVSKLKLEDLL